MSNPVADDDSGNGEPDIRPRREPTPGSDPWWATPGEDPQWESPKPSVIFDC
jgi:hypothetical protein